MRSTRRGASRPARPGGRPTVAAPKRGARIRALAAVGLLALSAGLGAGCGAPRERAGAAAYRPQAREITVTTIPLLVREDLGRFPFLRSDFARGGVLEGKEVYAFVPSTITVVRGDTLQLTFVNPEDDAHTFVLPEFAVALPGQRVTRATYVARRSGVFPIVCNMPSHLPMMSGQLVVLAASAMAGAGP